MEAGDHSPTLAPWFLWSRASIRLANASVQQPSGSISLERTKADSSALGLMCPWSSHVLTVSSRAARCHSRACNVKPVLPQK